MEDLKKNLYMKITLQTNKCGLTNLIILTKKKQNHMNCLKIVYVSDIL